MTAQRPTPQARWRAVLTVALLAGASAGCGGLDLGAEAREKLHQAQERNAQLRRDLDACRKELAARETRIRTLLALGDRRLQQLFTVAGIRLGRYTGGLDIDGEPGDEGVRVILRPVDATGSALKAAGDVTIELFDLAAEADRRIGRYRFGVETIGEHWSEALGSYHYSFDCLWQGPPPAHESLTIRVEFVDYLTGETFTTQRAVEVSPPAPSPTTTQADKS